MSTPQALSPELDALAKSLVAMKLAVSNNASNVAKVLRLHLRKRNTDLAPVTAFFGFSYPRREKDDG